MKIYFVVFNIHKHCYYFEYALLCCIHMSNNFIVEVYSTIYFNYGVYIIRMWNYNENYVDKICAASFQLLFQLALTRQFTLELEF